MGKQTYTLDDFMVLLDRSKSMLNEQPSPTDSIPPGCGVEKRTYSVDDLMEILDVSRSSVYMLIKRKAFKSIKIGNQLRIPRKSFDEWLDAAV